MEEHEVARKLRNEILPWIESAKLLKRQWFYRLHVVFGYATDLTIALGAVGITIPLATAIAQPTPDGKPVDVTRLLPADPNWLYYFGFFSVLIWIVLRVAFAREEGQKRAVLALSCSQAMKQADAKLYQILKQALPIPELNKLLDERIIPTIDHHTGENSYPWVGPAPTAEIGAAINDRVEELTSKFGSYWDNVESTQFRRAPENKP